MIYSAAYRIFKKNDSYFQFSVFSIYSKNYYKIFETNSLINFS